MHLKYIIRVNLHCKCFTLFNQRNNELGPASTLKLHMKDKTGCYPGRSTRCINGMDFRVSVIPYEGVGGNHSHSLIHHLPLPTDFADTPVYGKIQ